MSAQAASFSNTVHYITHSDRKMFITPFPIIFLQIKVSPWHLFPWQHCRYFTLPSTVNLSGYENSCASPPPAPQLATLALSVRPLKPTPWGSFMSDLDGQGARCLIFLLLTLPLIVSLKGLPLEFHMGHWLLICWIKTIVDARNKHNVYWILSHWNWKRKRRRG